MFNRGAHTLKRRSSCLLYFDFVEFYSVLTVITLLCLYSFPYALCRRLDARFSQRLAVLHKASGVTPCFVISSRSLQQIYNYFGVPLRRPLLVVSPNPGTLSSPGVLQKSPHLAPFRCYLRDTRALRGRTITLLGVLFDTMYLGFILL